MLKVYNKKININAIDKYINNETALKLIDYYCGIRDIDIIVNEIDLDNNSEELYLNKIAMNYKAYTTNEEREAFEKYFLGDEKAYHDIIMHNLKLVLYVAKNFKPYTNISEEDLISQGIFVLIQSVKELFAKTGKEYGVLTLAKTLYNDDVFNKLIKYYEFDESLANLRIKYILLCYDAIIDGIILKEQRKQKRKKPNF